jgi:pyridoxamine 5'-phosphate oxidase
MTPENPLDLFHEWMRQAEATEPNDPNAVALATATRSGDPSVRMVLIKRVDERGFCFFTNQESQKGVELRENPRAALCFHWKSLRRQVRVNGPISEMQGADVDAYFHSRSRNSQIGAAVSQQSRPLASRDVLEAKVKEFAAEHSGEIPRPAYWKGYCLQPERIEFWLDGAFRLHDRFLYTREGAGWKQLRLYP